MINWLTNASKKRIIREIKQILYDHPRYRADSEHVQNKFAFDERPQRGVIVNATSGDRVRLSADNYVGRISSFCMLTQVEGAPNTTVEWVRENFPVLESVSNKRDVFPSPPGSYICEIVSLPDEARGVPGTFTVNPYLNVINEPLIMFKTTGDTEAQLSRDKVYPGSVRLWLDGSQALVPDVDYHIDYETGAVTFLKTPPPGHFVHADYRYAAPQIGPVPFEKEHFNVDAIPGVVIAFGDRCQDCDKFTIVITDERTETADVYGGKFNINFDLIAFSKDSEDREKLSDYIIIKVLEKQNALGFEGIELVDISPGGENEDVFNPETDEYFYDSNISLSIRIDWAIHVPLPAVVWRAEFTSKTEEQKAGYLDGTFDTDLLRVAEPSDLIGSAAFIGNRGLTYERIK